MMRKKGLITWKMMLAKLHKKMKQNEQGWELIKKLEIMLLAKKILET
jgi:hypothetical protein